MQADIAELTEDSIARPQDIDPPAMEALLATSGLDVRVKSLTCEQIGAGQIGETVRFRIAYAGGAGPETLVGKFASTDPTSLAVASQWSLYEREVGFYRTLANRCTIDTPRCYGAALDQSGGFALLLEDLAPACPGDQFKGLSPADAELAVIEAARLHASFWECGEDPEFAWLDTDAGAQPFYEPAIFRDTWPRFRDRYGDHLERRHLEVCEALCEHYDSYDRPREGVRCITHNDFRPDNMIIGPGRLCVVDWQSVALGSAAVDIAYLIGGSYEPTEREAIEAHLLASYLAELRRQGVENCSDEQFAHDYRHFTFAGINVAVGAAMLVQRTERGDRMFLTMLDRHVAHVCAHDAIGSIAR